MIKYAFIALLFFKFANSQNVKVLQEHGFENLQEFYKEDQYTLFYEDNLYRFPADGLYQVLELINISTKASNAKVVILNKGVPIVEMRFTSRDYAKLKTKNSTIEDFLSVATIDFTDEKYNTEKTLNNSYFKTDLSLRFQLDYALGNFDNPIRQRVNFQPYLSTDLSKGVNFETYYNVPEFDDLGYKEPQVGLLRLSNDFKIDKSSFLNFNFGFFTFNRLGITTNYLKFLYKDKLRMNIHLGLTRFGRLNKDLILYYDLNTDLRLDFFSDLTYRINKYDMDLTFRYGSYILGDVGYTAQIRRFSGQRFIGLFYKKTNYGTMVGFDFSLPLPIRKYGRKLPVRAKFYDRFYLPYNYRSDTEVGLLYYQGDNIISRMTDYFPEILKKGVLRASKRGR